MDELQTAAASLGALMPGDRFRFTTDPGVGLAGWETVNFIVHDGQAFECTGTAMVANPGPATPVLKLTNFKAPYDHLTETGGFRPGPRAQRSFEMETLKALAENRPHPTTRDALLGRCRRAHTFSPDFRAYQVLGGDENKLLDAAIKQLKSTGTIIEVEGCFHITGEGIRYHGRWLTGQPL